MNRLEMIEDLYAIGHDRDYLLNLSEEDLLELYNHDFNEDFSTH